ncbi:hypothetical protein [Halomicrococcus gelatinilyticus]|uniref:hypothetical protein n=1 Tax=Halomicrococcus gelatinilyticus TaxID=1702103 RepID=UPI002E0D734A
MAPVTRRDALLVAGSGIAASIAGCLGRLDSGSSPEDDTTTDDTTTAEGDKPPESTETTDESDGNGGTGAVTDYETVQLGTTTGAPEWYQENERTAGDVSVSRSKQQLETILTERFDDGERPAAVSDLLEGVSFEESLFLYAESVGPDTCHDEVEVSGVEVSDGTLTATASVVDTSGEDEGCGQAVTFPAALVLVTFDGEPVSDVSVTVVDGWGNESGVGMASGESSASASGSTATRTTSSETPTTTR